MDAHFDSLGKSRGRAATATKKHHHRNDDSQQQQRLKRVSEATLCRTPCTKQSTGTENQIISIENAVFIVVVSGTLPVGLYSDEYTFLGTRLDCTNEEWGSMVKWHCLRLPRIRLLHQQQNLQF